MFSYDQCEKMVGIKPEYPVMKTAYRAYKNGECKVFHSLKEANDFSKLVEKFVVNEEEYQQTLKEYYAFEAKVRLFWLNLLKEEFNLPEKIFDVCYAEADERGHSYGYDAIRDIMYDVVEFYEKIMKAVKETNLELGE